MFTVSVSYFAEVRVSDEYCHYDIEIYIKAIKCHEFLEHMAKGAGMYASKHAIYFDSGNAMYCS